MSDTVIIDAAASYEHMVRLLECARAERDEACTQLAETRVELSKALAWLDRCSWTDAKIDLSKGPLEAQLAAAQAELAELRRVLALIADEHNPERAPCCLRSAGGECYERRAMTEALSTPSTAQPLLDAVKLAVEALKVCDPDVSLAALTKLKKYLP